MLQEMDGKREPEARIYWMDVGVLADAVCFDGHYRMMSPERRKKVDACLFPKDKRLSLGAGILFDRGLIDYGLRGREILVAYGENGKPYLPEHPHIHYNLSHSGGMAMAVFADAEAGCDVERIRQADMELAEHFFTPQEYAYIAGQRQEMRDWAFYRLWTLKESFVKAVGAGLAMALDSFCITILPDGSIGNCPGPDGTEYEFWEYGGGGYWAAVCLKKG